MTLQHNETVNTCISDGDGDGGNGTCGTEVNVVNENCAYGCDADRHECIAPPVNQWFNVVIIIIIMIIGTIISRRYAEGERKTEVLVFSLLFLMVFIGIVSTSLYFTSIQKTVLFLALIAFIGILFGKLSE
jgi:hypothetical protein